MTHLDSIFFSVAEAKDGLLCAFGDTAKEALSALIQNLDDDDARGVYNGTTQISVAELYYVEPPCEPDDATLRDAIAAAVGMETLAEWDEERLTAREQRLREDRAIEGTVQ